MTDKTMSLAEIHDGIHAHVVDLHPDVYAKDGRFIRYVLTDVQIPAGLVVGGFRFDPATGALSWSQNVESQDPDAVMSDGEREIRAKVAAEIRAEAQELRRLAGDAKDRRDDGDPWAAVHLDRFLAKAVALEQVAGRIAKGGDTNG